MYKMKQDLFEHVASINSENWNIYKLTKEYISSKHIPNQIIDNLKDYIDAVYSKQYEPIDRLLSFLSARFLRLDLIMKHLIYQQMQLDHLLWAHTHKSCFKSNPFQILTQMN